MNSRANEAVLSPGFEGKHWDRGDLNDATDASPVLGLIELSFKDPNSISGHTNPNTTLLDGAFEYISTVPGCISIYWGEIIANPNSVLCLIQWRSPSSWKLFQRSFGCGLVLGVLRSKPLNRVMRVNIENTIASREARITEAVSFSLPATSSEETRRDFEAAWLKILATATKGNYFAISGNWLERDVNLYNPDGPNKTRLSAEIELAARQPHVFVALLVWDAGEYYNRTSIATEEFENMTKDLATRFKLTISTASAQLTQWSKPPRNTTDVTAIGPATSTASLLDLQVKRTFDPEKSAWDNFDPVASESLQAVAARKRKFPLPYGGSWSMGMMSQYSIPDFPIESPYGSQPDIVLDMIWMQTKPNASDGLRAVRNLVVGCEAVYLCSDSDREWHFAMIICTFSFCNFAISSSTKLSLTFTF